MRVLVANAGSSSLKLSLLSDEDDLLDHHELESTRGEADAGEIAGALAKMDGADAVGHRIVHGGERFSGPVVVDEAVEHELVALTDLAPLHQAKSLAALRAVSAQLPDPPAVACFDTAFHATLPAAASTYALPEAWRRGFSLRRFGFHGLSHAYASRRAAQILGRDDLRLVCCHLGAGASLAAVSAGRSVDTTMGFTPLEGLVMATRSGSVDPGLLLWLLEHGHVSEPDMAEALEHESGLAGLAGSADMREIVRRCRDGDETAQAALDVYVHRLRGGVGAMAAALGGVDALVFTGGVGERSAQVRRLCVDGLGFLGARIDPMRNDTVDADAQIGDGSCAVLVVAAREDLEIARQVRSALA